MKTLSISDMMNMQNALQEKYKGIWSPVAPENAQNSLLWAIGEMGEIIDIFKKTGYEKAYHDPETRVHLMEETTDVMMYLWDMLACMGIKSEEFSEVYERKHNYNMKRTYGKGHFTDKENK